MRVAILGLGAMGAGMAANINQAGLLTAAWNRSPARAEAFFAGSGFSCAVSAEQAVAEADVVLSCVSADQDVLALIQRCAPALKPSGLWIDCSTVAVETAKSAATELAALGFDFLDAPVSGGKEGAEKGSLVVMAGGAEQAFKRAQPVFAAIASHAQLMGPVGAGQATKAVNQIMAAGINQAVTEAVAFADCQALDIKKVVDVVSRGAAGNWFLQHRGLSMAEGQYAPGFRVALHHKDLKISLQMAADCGAPSALIEKTLSDYEALMAAGYGDEDISALYRRKRQS